MRLFRMVCVILFAMPAWVACSGPAPVGKGQTSVAAASIKSSCPNASNYADGCAPLLAARQGGNFQYASWDAFSGDSRQSGQTWSSPKPPWNVAGVDYPVGYYTPRGSLKIPGVSPLPPGCEMTTNAGGGPQFQCHSTLSSISLVGWDFHPTSGPYAGQCVNLVINANAATGPGAAVTIADNHFQSDRQCSMAGAALLKIRETPAPGGVKILSNEFDGNCSVTQNAGGDTPVNDSRAPGAGPKTEEYNYFHDICLRPETDVTAAPTTFNFNLATRWCMLCAKAGTHGEVDEWIVPGGMASGVMHNPKVTASFNTIATPRTPSSCCTATFFFFGDGGSAFDEIEVSNNTVVTNTTANDGGYAYGAALMEVGVNYVGKVRVSGNYVDSTGARGVQSNVCIIDGAASRQIPGSIQGSILTVDPSWSLKLNGLIFPGGILYAGGVPSLIYPKIEPYGTAGTTGTGGAGTYALSAPATSGGKGGYTETTVVGEWDIPTGEPPHRGGKANWSLVSNRVISGYTIINKIGAPDCS
jgi:hypothetical protein